MRETVVKHALKRAMWGMGFEIHRLPSDGAPRKVVQPLPLDSSWLDRLAYLQQMYERIQQVPGDVVECGVGRGGSLFLLAYLMRANVHHHARTLWGVDSFQGFPEPTPEDASPRNPKEGEWYVTQEAVIALLEESGIDREAMGRGIRLIPGFFKESLKQFPDRPIALLHLDADLYQSYRDALTALFPKIVRGGVVLFDEYRSVNFPGATKAVDEYFADRPESVLQDAGTGKFYLVKLHDS